MKSFPASVLLVVALCVTALSLGYIVFNAQPDSPLVYVSNQQVAQVGGSLPSGAIAAWDFNAGSGSSVTDSIGGNTLSFVGSPTWTTGRTGSGLSFSGSGDALRRSSISLSSQAVTVSFWLKNDTWGNSQTELIELSDNNNLSTAGFGIYVNDTPSCSLGQISVVTKGDAGYNASCYATPGTGVWHHYGFVLDKSQNGAGEIKVYMDGALQTANKVLYSSNNNNSFSSNSFNVMSRAGEGSPTATGIMDDLMVFSRALSASEIASIISYTPTPADTTAPALSSISASGISTTGASISWNTDEASDTQVEYGITTSYGSNTALNSSLSTSHSQTLSGLQSGTLYHYRVKSKDSAGNQAVSTDQTFTTTAVPTVNQAPVVSLSLSATSISAGGSVTVTANATDADGISRVEIYNGPSRIANLTSAPYTFTWSNIPTGTYTLSALAYDTKGLTGVSSLKTLSVSTIVTSDTVAPTVPTGLTATAISSTQINLSWTASSDNVGVVGYQVFRSSPGSAAIQIANITPAATSFSNNSGLVPGTTYTYTVRAYDAKLNYSGSSVSATAITLSIVNQAPVVSLSLSATSISAGGSVTLTANATDADGISRVEIYNGPSRIANLTSAPYTFTWSNIPTGTYTLSALAYDTKGLTGVSSLKTLSVGTVVSNNYNLTLTTSGSNTGTVTKSVNGVTTTATSFPSGTVVRLTAIPASSQYTFDGSVGSGWSGVCTGSASTCDVVMNADKSVNANFVLIPTTQTYTVTKGAMFNGTFACNPTNCTQIVGSTMTLTAQPNPGFKFSSWTGCSSNSATCIVSGASLVTASFILDASGPSTCTGTCYYVRPGGTGNGTDWSNAYGVLPATLVRGATYYVAGGSYPPYTFNTVESGSSVITIKKASPADHGTDTGWVSSYGTTQAVFTSQFKVHRGNFVLDGSYRNESDWFDGSAYGFKIKHNNDFSHLIIRDETGSRNVNNITVKYLFIAAQIGVLGSRPYAIDTDTYSSVIRNTGYVFSRNYVEGSNNPYFVRNTIDPLIEYSASSKTSGNATYHGEVVNRFYSSNGVRGGGVIRYNHFRDAYNGASGYPKGGGTGVIAISETSGAEIYGNIFERYYVGDGAIAAGWYNNNIKVYNNTFIDGVQGSGALVRFTSTGATVSGNVANNNLAVNTANTTFNGDGTFAYNATAPTSALVNYAGGDYRLVQPSPIAGTVLSSPFNKDRNGNTRGTDGFWDVGAYEYTGGGSIPNPVPVGNTYNLSVTRSGLVAGTVSGGGVTCTTTCVTSAPLSTGSSVTLTASAVAGTNIVWTGCSSTAGNTTTSTCTINANSVPAGTTITVNVAFNPGTVVAPTTPSSTKFSAGNSIKVSGTGTVLNIRSSPSTVASISGTATDGSTGTVGSNASNGIYTEGYYWWYVTINNITGWAVENYLVANNVVQTFNITSSVVGSNGTISPSGATSVISGGSQTYTIRPNTGYAISQVLVDNVNVGAVSTYQFSNVTAPHTISATFSLIPVTTLPSTKYNSGSAVQVSGVGANSFLNVRSSPSTSGTSLGTHIDGDKGVIVSNISNGVYAGGYFWWYVDFSSGADGWVAENYLTASTVVVNPPPVVPTTNTGSGCSGTCYYVTSTGSGTRSGADWNNAYGFSNVTSGTNQGLASSNMKRGATYYFAGGSYPAMALDDAEVGTQWIKIHKATSANSGNVAGWTSGLGAQTNIGYIALASDYYEIDGQTRNELKWNDDTSYGFKTLSIIAHWDNYKPGADNIVIKNTSIGGKLNKPMTDTDFAGGINIEGGPGGRSNYTIVNNYIHDIATPIWFSSNSNGFTIENNFIGPSRGKEAIMGIYGAYNVVVRNNILVDNCQDNPYSDTANGCSAEITGFSASGQFNFNNWEVSGNLITRKNVKTTPHSDAAIAGGGTSSVTGWKVFNNVISSMYGTGLNRVHVKISTGGGNTAYNNIWYDIGANGQTGCVADSCTNNITVTTDPYRYLSPAIKNQLPL